MTPASPPKAPSRGARAVSVGLLLGLLILIPLRLVVIGFYRVTSTSMAPTLLVGDWLLIDKVSYRHEPIQRGDVVVFQRATDPVAQVKRVIGLPGDHIELKANTLIINGVRVNPGYLGEVSLDESGEAVDRPIKLQDSTLLEERFEIRGWQIVQGRASPLSTGSWTVPAGELFVLGDNRDASLDSRDPKAPPVSLSDVQGRAVMVAFSAGPKGMRSRHWIAVP